MKTHAQENYHICPYPDCGKRYAHEYKLKNHIASHHEKVVSYKSIVFISFIGFLPSLVNFFMIHVLLFSYCSCKGLVATTSFALRYDRY